MSRLLTNIVNSKPLNPQFKRQLCWRFSSAKVVNSQVAPSMQNQGLGLSSLPTEAAPMRRLDVVGDTPDLRLWDAAHHC